MSKKSKIVWDKTQMTQDYQTAKEGAVGTQIKCPTCKRIFVKTSYQQAFCRMRGKNGKTGNANMCKDQYWNFIRGIGNPYKNTRTMSMSKLVEEDERGDEFAHPFSEEAFSLDIM